MTLDIEPSDVIRLIQQYLKENNLVRTLQTLQDETSVSLNTVDSIETFVRDINSGHWDVVLKVVKLLKLPDNKLIDLYEQIAIELIEFRETRAANWLIHKAGPMLKLKSSSPDRYLHLQNLLGRSFFDPKEAYGDGSTKDKRRNAIANALKKEVTVVPPERLLTLLRDSLRWQKHEGLLPSGSSIDIFTGKAQMVHAEEETYPNVLHRHCIKPFKSLEDDDMEPIFVCCAEFSPDGHYMLVGFSTGLIEVRNPTTGRIANDLKYQLQRNYIVTPTKTAALSICFSTSEILAVGDKSGDISVWKLSTGQLVQLFKAAHHKSVSCLMFHRNGKDILSGGHDSTVKLHGMRSNKTVRDFRGHKSFVNSVAFTRDDNYVVSGSSDSTVKIWNAKTAQVLHEYKSPGKVHTVLLMTQFKNDIFLVGDRTSCIQLIDLEGNVKAKLIADTEHDEQKGGSNEISDQPISFFAACSSPKGNWIYSVDSTSIYCYNYSTKKVFRKLSAVECKGADLIGVKHHPFLNLLVTFDTQGNLKLWKP